MLKTASQIADIVLEKIGFAVTEKGHAFDAALAESKKKQLVEEAGLLQKDDGMTFRGEGGGVNMNIGGRMRHGLSSALSPGNPLTKARHQAYVAKQHQEGSNAWNPWGGSFTPLEEEKGGKSWGIGGTQYGDVR